MLNRITSVLLLSLVTALVAPLGAAEEKAKPSEKGKSTLGAKAPKGAIVLFDGTINEFTPGKTTEAGTLTVPQRSKHVFAKDFTLHVEFRCPKGSSGNSGVYLQNAYEIQVLNSHGKEKLGKGDCGAIYSVRVPDVNASLPPLSWQTHPCEAVIGSKFHKCLIAAALELQNTGPQLQIDVRQRWRVFPRVQIRRGGRHPIIIISWVLRSLQ